MIDFLVARDDLRRCHVDEAATPEPRPGEILLRIDKFGFSANNVTYAALGEAMRYWDFFPAPAGWGRIPVWGYGEVVRSRHEAIRDGERIFGYLPMSTHAVLQPGHVTATAFEDSAPHRADLPGVYQRYRRVTTAEDEDQEALWRPLFMTSFGAADYLVEHDHHEARAVVVSSASSKTALGTAFLMQDVRLIGLTSAANVEFCRRVGYYDEVLAYEELSSLARDTPTLLVDFAGNERILGDLRNHLGQSVTATIVVGATHWDERAADGGLGGAGTHFFFLPAWMELRRGQWAPGEFGRRYAAAWSEFLPSAKSWLRIVHAAGAAPVESVYRELLDGRSDPSVGHILSLQRDD